MYLYLLLLDNTIQSSPRQRGINCNISQKD